MSKYVQKGVNNHCMYLDAFIYARSVLIVLYFQTRPSAKKPTVVFCSSRSPSFLTFLSSACSFCPNDFICSSRLISP